METGLSEWQVGILAYIREYLAEHGYPPTIREIGGEIGIGSTSVVAYNLSVLARRGYLARDPQVSRGLRLTELGAGARSDGTFVPTSPAGRTVSR